MPVSESLPAPLVPVRVARSLSSLTSLPDLTVGVDALMSGGSLAAVSHFSRALEIVARMGDPYAHIGIQRLLAAAYHEAGEWQQEKRVRAALLDSGGGQWPTSGSLLSTGDAADVDYGADDRLMALQHVSSYVALQSLLLESADNHVVLSILESASSDSQIEWRATACALQAILRRPVDDSQWQQQHAAYHRALDMITTMESTQPSLSCSSPPPAPLSLLHAGDLHCLLADSHISRGDKQQAHSHYQQSAQYWRSAAAVAGRSAGTVPLMRGGLQVPEVPALCGLGESSVAVRLTEERLGASHPCLAVSLRLAALQQEAEGEAIVAEGLLRSSIAQLEAHIAQPARTMAMHVSPAELRLELVNSQWQYAQLLSKLEWNGSSRKAEAEHWIKKIDYLVARHAYLRPQWQHLQQNQEQAIPSSTTPFWLIERLSL